jgi:hypothetical protein
MEIADQGVWPLLNHTDTKTAKNYRLNYQPTMSNGLTPCSAPKDLPCGEQGLWLEKAAQ